MPDQFSPLFTDHSRHYRENKFVYPVLSRRSHGISLGVNLNPDKVCNFDCIYCQVDRRSEAETKFLETERLMAELDSMLGFVTSGAIYEDSKFSSVPSDLRRLNDIAFSGDGEPTTYQNFDQIVLQAADLKKQHGLVETKMLLITNATMFHRTKVQDALDILDANNGEIWAKLESGTEEYYHLVARTKIPFQQILDNITLASQKRPIIIQSLFMKIQGESPSEAEILAFCDRLNDIKSAGGLLKLIQIYTVARQPAESFVASLEPAEVDSIANVVNRKTNIPTDVFYGPA